MHRFACSIRHYLYIEEAESTTREIILNCMNIVPEHFNDEEHSSKDIPICNTRKLTKRQRNRD
jgi:hypothetical protein